MVTLNSCIVALTVQILTEADFFVIQKWFFRCNCLKFEICINEKHPRIYSEMPLSNSVKIFDWTHRNQVTLSSCFLFICLSSKKVYHVFQMRLSHPHSNRCPAAGIFFFALKKGVACRRVRKWCLVRSGSEKRGQKKSRWVILLSDIFSSLHWTVKMLIIIIKIRIDPAFSPYLILKSSSFSSLCLDLVAGQQLLLMYGQTLLLSRQNCMVRSMMEQNRMSNLIEPNNQRIKWSSMGKIFAISKWRQMTSNRFWIKVSGRRWCNFISLSREYQIAHTSAFCQKD